MEDLLSCMVCCEPYQEKMRHPVLLPRCGHSFCRPCIAFMVKGGNVVCPSCRMDQRVETADDLPTEFSLLAITAAQQVAKLETCQVHDVKLSFWCKSCKMATCGECLFEDHPTHSHDVIKATRYIIEMKDAINDLANKFMETLDIRERRLYDMVYKSAKGINDALRTICVLRKDMEEARDLMKGVKKVDGIAPTTRLSEAAKFLGLKWNLHDAKLGLVPASLKKDQAKAQGEKKEAELQKEAEEKKQDSPEEKEEDKEKEDNAKEDKEKESDDKTKQTKDGENKEDDDEDEESTDESEEEVLTEEELKKRQKILKVKERIAAAAAAAAAEKELKEKKMMEKERKAVKEKNNNASTEPEQVPSPKLLKPWKKRSVVAPVSREPSITPERELEKKERSEKIESPTEKEDANKQNDKDKENAENEDKEKKEETEAKAENGEPNNEKDNKETKETENNAPAKKDASQESAANDPPKAATEPSNVSPPKDKEKAKEETEAKEAKREAETKKEAKKTPSTAKRPRGRLARQALKRAQTMDLSKRVQADGDKEEGEAESQNIKGLDLETGKSNKPEEAENKENEAGATGETKEEAKDDKNEEEKKEEKTEEEKKKEDETRGATAVKEDEEDTMFELDPDEKDRIATELMMVPSLTVCVEGRGGLMARVQWEPQGLHVYSHQAQDLPYDVLIKSSVLNALIPTKSPTVFLDIEYEQRMLGRVYITLFGHLRRANNFLLLCTGETGASLKSSKFFEVCNPEAPGERLKGGDYEFNNGRGGEALVEELEFGGDYAQPMEAGMITAGGSGHRCFDSQFLICTEGDPNRSFACPFGVVTSGLSYLKEAVWLVVTKEIWIEECGVLLDVPRF